jgi:hypothetical protein
VSPLIDHRAFGLRECESPVEMDEKNSYEDFSNYTSKLEMSHLRSTDFYANYEYYEQTLVFILLLTDTSCKTLMGMDS